MSAEARTIWKYTISLGDTRIDMPQGAKILAVQFQAGEIALWALVWPHLPMEKRAITIYGTGHPIPAAPGDYIGTVQTLGGALVWHVFDETEARRALESEEGEG